jgi:D-arabinose 1-dehydrogenase-like Zn-dependent alcohol dehydrogenase
VTKPIPHIPGAETAGEVERIGKHVTSLKVKLIGSTGGTRNDFREIIDISKESKIRVWKKFKLDEAKEALQALFAKERDGRIMLEI